MTPRPKWPKALRMCSSTELWPGRKKPRHRRVAADFFVGRPARSRSHCEPGQIPHRNRSSAANYVALEHAGGILVTHSTGYRELIRYFSLNMLRFLAPTLLLSLALPSASSALGLGDIQVESSLHQPLAAQIDLLGATTDDLAGLSARVADEEMFRLHGLERPSFLSAIVLKVSQDKQGRPVIVLRSTEASTEPLVTFLVDLHSPDGELIRE